VGDYRTDSKPPGLIIYDWPIKNREHQSTPAIYKCWVVLDLYEVLVLYKIIRMGLVLVLVPVSKKKKRNLGVQL